MFFPLRPPADSRGSAIVDLLNDSAARDNEQGIEPMRFYWDGYAEVLHLVTTTRTLPPRVAARRPAPEPATSPPRGLRRLWRGRGRSEPLS